MQMLLPVWLSLWLWAISITGYWACSPFKKLRTSPLMLCVPLRDHTCARCPNEAPPQTLSSLLSCKRSETGSSECEFLKRDRKARLLHIFNIPYCICDTYFLLKSLFKLSAWLRGVERERQGESGVQNAGYPRGRRLLPQERPVLNKSFNFHAQLPYLPLIQCGSE